MAATATRLADAGVEAVKAGKYDEGIDLLTAALKYRSAPLWHLERSTAYLRTNRFGEALDDAERALRVSYDRANRHQMAQAQLRRAISLFRMDRFADADVCAFWAIRLCDGFPANETDRQQEKVDINGNYMVRAQEVQDEAKPRKTSDTKKAALNPEAMQTKESGLRNQAVAWRVQALTRIEQLPEGHDGAKPHGLIKYPDPSKLPTVKSEPVKRQLEESESKKGEPVKREPEESTTKSPSTTGVGGDAGGKSGSVVTAANANPGSSPWERLWAEYHQMHMQHKIRCSFYQSEMSLTVDLFLKNLSPDQVLVDADTQAITITPRSGASLGSFPGAITITLYGDIKPEETKCVVKSMKIELTLQKKTMGKWPSLRHINSANVDNLVMGPGEEIPFDQFVGFVKSLGYEATDELERTELDTNPAVWYAALLEKLVRRMHGQSTVASTASSRPSQPKDSTEASAAKEVAAVPSRDDKAAKTASSAPAYPTSSRTGPKNWDNIDDGDDDEAANAGDVNNFFSQLYQGADDDTKRAMMKSFVESNGTALSTSWSDAKSKTYKTEPPDGVEAKKWD